MSASPNPDLVRDLKASGIAETLLFPTVNIPDWAANEYRHFCAYLKVRERRGAPVSHRGENLLFLSVSLLGELAEIEEAALHEADAATLLEEYADAAMYAAMLWCELKLASSLTAELPASLTLHAGLISNAIKKIWRDQDAPASKNTYIAPHLASFFFILFKEAAVYGDLENAITRKRQLVRARWPEVAALADDPLFQPHA